MLQRADWTAPGHAETWALQRWIELTGHLQRAPMRSAGAWIQDALRAGRALHSSERRWASDTLFSLIRMLRRNKALTGQKNPSPESLFWTDRWDRWMDVAPPGEPLPASLQAALLRCGLDAAALAQQRQSWEAALQEINSHPDPASIDFLQIGDCFSYPTWIVAALLQEQGTKRTIQILSTQNGRAPLTIRVNTEKTSRTALMSLLLQTQIATQPTRFSDAGLVLDTHQNLYQLDAFQQGLFEIQDEGSQLIASLVAPPPGGVVIDACAGAGGKTLALGALLKNRGRIVALDIDDRKLQELRKRARRAGLTNVAAQHWSEPPHAFPLADRVLCDAPCSGLGTLRRNPEARWALQATDPASLHQQQLGILRKCAPLVKPGGRLIYATCTILSQENQQTVAAFLAEHPTFSLVPAKEIWGSAQANLLGDGTFLQTMPLQPIDSDGFFAAVLRKKS